MKCWIAKSIILLAIMTGTTGRTAPTEPERPLVAFLGFQIQLDPNRGWNPLEDYRNMTAASTFSQALWGQLSGVDGIAWVEREKLDAICRELQLSAALSPSPAEQLKLGHLVSAQWLLTGAFSRASPTNSRSLRMQVIHATNTADRRGGVVAIRSNSRSKSQRLGCL